MSGFDQWLSASLSTGALPVWMAGALAALLVFAGIHAFRRAAQLGVKGLGSRVALIAVGAGLAWILVGSTGGGDKSAGVRALEARANDLTLRTLVPGSPLACLDMVGNETVETGCEKTLFANSQTVAAAASYVDARLSLLADGLELAARDRSYEASIERTRRALEEDRFGIVAHVLSNRGCTAENCPALKLLRNSRQVATNLRERSFDANVILHAAAWNSPPAAPAASPAPSGAPALASVPSVTTTGSAPPLPAGKYDFPSSASIPAISIMNAEPALPPGEPIPQSQQNPPPSAPAKPAPRRQSTRETPQPAQPAPQAAQPPPLPPPGTNPLPPPGTIANPR